MILKYMNTGSLNVVAMFIILIILSVIVQFLLLQYGQPSPD
jgi:hypothetical protein